MNNGSNEKLLTKKTGGRGFQLDKTAMASSRSSQVCSHWLAHPVWPTRHGTELSRPV